VASQPDLSRRFLEALTDAAAAHSIMLRDLATIDDGYLASILGAIDQARGADLPRMPLALVAPLVDERIDSQTARGALGGAQLGRGQTDLAVTGARLVLRDRLLVTLPDLLQLRRVIEEFVSSHSVTLMQVNVHAQGAQASTLGHIAAPLVAALERGSGALEQALSEINRLPLGAGIGSGTGFSIDRARTAELLGMPEVIDLASDAVGGVDYLLALANGIERVASPISRWLDELMALMRANPDAFAIEESWQVRDVIAPQWQAAAGISALAAHGRRVEAEAAAIRSVAQRLPWGAIPGEIGAYLPVADSAIGQLDVLIERTSYLMERALIVNRAALANRAGRDFVTAGDLADFLMIEEQIEPQAARTIAGMVIGRAREAGLEASGITVEMIDTAALMVIGREIKVEFETISKYLAPRRYIERRNQTGGPAPSAMKSWLAGAERRREVEFATIEAKQLLVHQAATARSRELELAVATGSDS
jgi:argininosuccinate lyase